MCRLALYTDNVVVGTATADASYAGDANHFGNTDSTTFEIPRPASTVTITCPVSEVYTGSAIEPCTAPGATGVGLPSPMSARSRYADNVNVGTATASSMFAGDANHTGNTDSTTFEITQAA